MKQGKPSAVFASQNDLALNELLLAARSHFAAGRTGPAQELYGRILKLKPNHGEGLRELSRIALQKGQVGEAVILGDKAVEAAKNDPRSWYHMALACQAAGDQNRADHCFVQAVLRESAPAEAWLAAAQVCARRNDLVDQELCYRRALEADEVCSEARLALNQLLAQKTGLSPVAVGNAQAALQAGVEHHHAGLLDAAQAEYLRALEWNPSLAPAHSNLGALFVAKGDVAQAKSHYLRAIELAPGFAEAHYNLAHLHHVLGDVVNARECYLRALELNPAYVQAHNNLALILQLDGDYSGAADHYRASVQTDAEQDYAQVQLAHCLQNLCAWQEWQPVAERERARVAAGKGQGIYPFSFMAMATSAAEQLNCARQFSSCFLPSSQQAAPISQRRPGPRLRVGYLSTDFRQHAMASLVTEMFGLHNRDFFEVFAYSYGSDDGSLARQKIMAAVDHFRDVQNESVAGMAEAIRADGIDILVDLMGYTGTARYQVLAYRSAPIQLQFLGYQGTMGTPCVDYLVADRIAVPQEYRKWYDERIVWMPDTYQPNDRHREMGPKPTRSQAGLPAKGVVFCAMHQPFKILPDVFDCWMRLLKRVPGSVLWLLEYNPWMADKLRQEAIKRGVEPARLVFAPKRPAAEYLAHMQLADVYLDTWACNAGATASDALWAGVPVITWPGETLSSRMASSLLHAAGLPELVASGAQDYEDMAFRLATESSQRAALKRRLRSQRDKMPLFDTPRYVQHLEVAFQAMWQRYQNGLAPDHLDVPAGAVSALLDLTLGTQPVGNESSQPAVSPAYAELLAGLGHHKEGRLEAAREHYQRAVELDSSLSAAHNNLGSVCTELGDFAGAEAHYRQALQVNPLMADAHYNLGYLNQTQGKPEIAEQFYLRALELNPNSAGGHNNLASIYQMRGDFLASEKHFRRAVEITPEYGNALVQVAHSMQNLCRWQGWDSFADRAKAVVAAGRGQDVFPFSFLAMGTRGEEQLNCARQYGTSLLPIMRSASTAYQRRPGPRLRIGYVSADFRLHAMVHLISELLELHDRQFFEIFAYSYGPDDGSTARQRIVAAVDHFRDLASASASQMAEVIRGDGIDILVDLMGYTGTGRYQVLAHRPAPIQIQTLGYLGTMGMPCVDYLIADDFVVPEERFRFYDEKIVWMPGCYQPNDRQRVVGAKPTRAQAGLPAKGMVFCAFHQPYKISPEVFDCWMRLLNRVPGSVLWLLDVNPTATENLKKEAESRGLDVRRLVFGAKCSVENHLQRLQLADVYLDAWRVNGGTTVSDALWVGVPVVTLPGETFVTRVAGSLARAAGLSSLVARSALEYEELAYVLATKPARLAAIKRSLKAHRGDLPLFNTPLYTRHLEAAYQAMWGRFQHGLAPDHLSIPAEAMPKAMDLAPANPPSLAADSKNPEALAAEELNAGLEHHGAGRLDVAQAHYLRALELNPGLVSAHNNLGAVYGALGDRGNAEARYRHAMALSPDFGLAYYNLGHLHHIHDELEEAEKYYWKALELNPLDSGAHNNLGSIFQGRADFVLAEAHYRQAAEIKPEFGHALVQAAHAMQNLCQWHEWENFALRTRAVVAAGKGHDVFPFSFLAMDTTAAEQQNCARQYGSNLERFMRPAPRLTDRKPGTRLRIGYLSADFRQHAMASLMAETLELHDRNFFEIFAYSFGPDDGTPTRRRLMAGVDHFRDITLASPEAMSDAIREDGIDILVDLMGYTGLSRYQVLPYRSAPIQVQTLGYVGTMGTPAVDYLIADDFVVPEDALRWYDEKIVWMPECYQPNDTKREVGPKPTRAQAGLPAKGVVLCAFHSSFKILPDVFDCWMRLLNRIPGSVLWLVASNPSVTENLQREAQVRGVDSSRLIFAPRRIYADYMAHLQLADIYLDTWAYNAGTTASEALWMGVPVVTKVGGAFSSRMAGSLLRAAGLPELATATAGEYEEVIYALATESTRRAALKRKIRARRDAMPLFDAARYTRHLEAAFQLMWQRHRDGLPPELLRIEPGAGAQPMLLDAGKADGKD